MADPTSADGGAERDAEWRFDDLRALYVNCTLKCSPQLSHTQGLIDRSRAIMKQHGVAVTVLRAADHDIATGRVARHDRARLAKRRLARHPPAGAGRRHPGAVRADLAG
jgi:hypothetical protein